MTSDDTDIKFATLPNELFFISGQQVGEHKVIRSDSVTLIEPGTPTDIEETGLRITHWRLARPWKIEHYREDGLLLRTKYASPHLPVEIGGYGVRLQWDADGVARAYVGRCD